MTRRGNPGGFGLLLCALATVGPDELAAQRAGPCLASARVGLAVPVSEPPLTDLESGPGGGVGLVCGLHAGFVIGGGYEAAWLGPVWFNYLLGTVGFEARAESGRRLLLHFDAGLGFGSDRRTILLILPSSGNGTSLDGSSVVIGGGGSFESPIAGRWAWAIDASVRTAFVRRIRFPDLEDDGFSALTTILFTIGVTAGL